MIDKPIGLDTLAVVAQAVLEAGIRHVESVSTWDETQATAAAEAHSDILLKPTSGSDTHAGQFSFCGTDV